MADSTRFTRKELYDMVWNEPISRIAKRLGSSDVAIAKICSKMDIPRPPRGHWARAEHGYPVEQQPLPKAKPDTIFEWELVPQGPRMTSSIPKQKAPEIDVPEVLRRPHRELVGLASELKSAWKDKYGRVATADQLIHVFPSTVSRSKRILTSLLNGLETRGHPIYRKDGALLVSVQGEDVALSIFEPAKQIPHPNPSEWGYPKWDYISSDKLTLTMSVPGFYGMNSQWSGTKRKPLEKKLGEIVLAIEHAPTLIAQRRREDEIRERRWARERLVRRRLNDRVRLSHERARSVEALARNLDRARQIRALVSAINAADSVSPSSKRLARWASQYADHLDPLAPTYIPVLDEEIPGTYC